MSIFVIEFDSLSLISSREKISCSRFHSGIKEQLFRIKTEVPCSLMLKSNLEIITPYGMLCFSISPPLLCRRHSFLFSFLFSPVSTQQTTPFNYFGSRPPLTLFRTFVPRPPVLRFSFPGSPFLVLLTPKKLLP